MQCNGVSYDHMVVTTWKYSLEKENDFTRENAKNKLEQALLDEVSKSDWQRCTQDGDVRRLTKNNIDMVAVDKDPADTFIDDESKFLRHIFFSHYSRSDSTVTFFFS